MAQNYSLLLLPLFAAALAAQTPQAKPAPPKPDVLILNDDERLIGHLLRSNGSSVVFKSDLLGEVTIDWAKIKELHAAGPYVVVGKNVKLGRHPVATNLPHGSITASNQTITIEPAPEAPPVSMPVAEAAHIMEEPVFQKSVISGPSLIQAWNGAITGGFAIVQATQESRAFNGAVHLIRAVPTETWLPPRDRTIIDFSASEGSVEEPSTGEIKTQIVHAAVERDEYFSTSRVYFFGQAIFDHNYSQGLDLQQNYGGGVGWTAIDKAAMTLDVKGTASYVRQQFTNPASDHNLIGSTFAQSLVRRLPRGMILLEQISFTPAWNEMHAWLATAGTSLTAPVYKRLSFSIAFQDNFLNDPPPGFQRNSFQTTTGLTYTLH
jgi:hypothetical protein